MKASDKPPLKRATVHAKPAGRGRPARHIVREPAALAPAVEEPFSSSGPDGVDRLAGNDSIEGVAEADVPRESEQAIAAAEWIDAESGGPTEGQSPPHLDEH
ncbi:MAG: hypothetical protein JNN03_13740 [Rubrivivax sp.]|nr:hypothetical protein [Rubrivivax sp.]